jgi:hypothetical protein
MAAALLQGLNLSTVQELLEHPLCWDVLPGGR